MSTLPKTITIRLNPYDQAVFKACKDYLLDKESENEFYGFPRDKITNAVIIRKALNALWEEGRQYRINHI